MPELIDRQAAIKLLNEMQGKASTGLEDVTIYRAINALREMTSIEPKVRLSYGCDRHECRWQRRC